MVAAITNITDTVFTIAALIVILKGSLKESKFCGDSMSYCQLFQSLELNILKLFFPEET